MLTVKQPPSYGYKSVHDLPTPPSTSRPSPPLSHQEYSHKVFSGTHRSHSPPSQSMSTPHRGLPPPAAMTLPPQHQPQQPQQQQQQQQQQPSLPPPAPVAPPPAHHAPPPPPPPPSLTQVHQTREPWGPLPPPPQQWQGAEDSMRNWLKARVEDDRRRQEEEKTRQETLRLEQRKIEMDMLRTSLEGGIPPVMIPLVFAGMGNNGLLPQAALDWAQQYLPPQSQQLQILPPQPVSPEHHREPQAHPSYGGLPRPGAPPQQFGYPGSPTRPRGQTLPGSIGRPMVTMSHLPSLNTNVPQPPHPGASAMAPQPHLQQAQVSQQESHASPSIYFHHWQPPTSQPSSSNRPGSPSGDTPKKRKAAGQPTASPTRGETRFRSPPAFGHGSFSTTARPRRGHTRQRSDMSSYRSSESGRSRRESFGGPLRGMSPIPSSALGSSQGPSRGESGSSERSEPPKHSVSSMLSEEPRQSSQMSAPSYMGEGGEKRQRRTPPSDSRSYGRAPDSSALHEVEGEG